MITRRTLLKTAIAGAAMPREAVAHATQRAASARSMEFCFFSKALPELGWSDLGKAVREAGFGGVDLTVRANGHVLPERAADDLPRAVEAIRAQGVAVPMITTELTSAGDPAARGLLLAAAKSGVRYFKPGYWHYTSPDVRGLVAKTAADLESLTALARDCGIELGFHNHAGYVGAALWDIAPVMDRLDSVWAGYYFDPHHAVAEGSGGAFKAATHLVAPRLKMVALKDFVWQKTGTGWRIVDCPLGEGAVDWRWIASALRDARFAGPVSIHIEYEIPPIDRTRRTLQAAMRDLAFARDAIGISGKAACQGHAMQYCEPLLPTSRIQLERSAIPIRQELVRL
jgi:sugar phosphate isomerase/epimerase